MTKTNMSVNKHNKENKSKKANINNFKFKIVKVENSSGEKFLLITNKDYMENVNNFINMIKTDRVYKKSRVKDMVDNERLTFNVLDGSRNIITLEEKYYKHLGKENYYFTDDMFYIY